MNCRHCGGPLSMNLQRLWPNYPFHATCASTPLVDGVCPHAECCCVAHKKDKK